MCRSCPTRNTHTRKRKERILDLVYTIVSISSVPRIWKEPPGKTGKNLPSSHRCFFEDEANKDFQQRLKNPIDYPIGNPIGPIRSLNLSWLQPVWWWFHRMAWGPKAPGIGCCRGKGLASTARRRAALACQTSAHFGAAGPLGRTAEQFEASQLVESTTVLAPISGTTSL